MNNYSMVMDTDVLKELASELNQKIMDIENCYSDIRKSVKDIDGSNDNWKGNNQMKFYNSYFELSKNFPENIKKLTDFYNFLVNTIKSYEERDKGLSQDIDSNADNFDI